MLKGRALPFKVKEKKQVTADKGERGRCTTRKKTDTKNLYVIERLGEGGGCDSRELLGGGSPHGKRPRMAIREGGSWEI